MSPPQRHIPVCICGDSSPMSPALTTSVLHGTRAGPVCTRWGSSPISPLPRDPFPPCPPCPSPPFPLCPVPPFTPWSWLFYKLVCLFLVSLHSVSSVGAAGSFLFKVWWFSVLPSSWMSRTVRCRGWVPARSTAWHRAHALSAFGGEHTGHCA